MKKLTTLFLILLLPLCLQAQGRPFRRPIEVSQGEKWSFKTPKNSPITIMAGPNFTISYIPLKYARGANHDLGYNISGTYKNLYLDYSHSFTQSYFTYQSGALGYSFTWSNKVNGMILSPNIGVGGCKVKIPLIAGYYDHTYTMVGLGLDARFYIGRILMGFNYRNGIVTENHKSSVHTISCNLGYRIK